MLDRSALLSFFFFSTDRFDAKTPLNKLFVERLSKVASLKLKFEIFHCSSRIGCTHDSTCEGRVLNTSRTSIPSVLRNVGRSGQESGDFVMSGNCEIETNCNTGGAIPKYFSIPTGGVACSRRNRKRAAPPDLHPKSLSKKKKKLLCHEAGVTFHFRETDPPLSLPFFAKSVHWGDYSFSKHLPRARTIIIFLQQFRFSILLSRIESRFLDFIRVGLRFLVAETRERRQALVKSRASTHVDNSIHPLTQEISRVCDSSVESPPSPIEQIPPLLLLSPYG